MFKRTLGSRLMPCRFIKRRDYERERQDQSEVTANREHESTFKSHSPGRVVSMAVELKN
jgi:hypothetical protein